MQGFGACIRQFPLLEEPITRQRTLLYRRRRGQHMSNIEMEAELRWIETSLRELEQIMEGLPDILKLGWALDEPMDDIRLAVMGMQRANLAITEVSIRFALVSLKWDTTDFSRITRRNFNRDLLRWMLNEQHWGRKRTRHYLA
jgi:hypothetical protein